MDLLQKFKNLIVMAAADGSFSERELQFLIDRSTKWHISDAEVADAMESALSDDAHLEIPSTHEERTEMLRDLIRMMAADGQLVDVEKNLFALAAAKMKISNSELNEIIDSVL